MILEGDFNINVQDFEENKKVKNFVNLMFQFGLVPTTNKPTRVTNKKISAIHHIITNSIYNNDFKTGIRFMIYDGCFPKTKFKIKSNNKANPWVKKGIAKSSKRKQKLYEKFLKICSIQNEKIYKDYTKFFERITMKSKRKYYSEKLLQF